VRMLKAIGIDTETKLRSMGAVAAFVAVRRAGLAPSLNLLWALEGALRDRDWKVVARDDRTLLLMQLEDMEKAQATTKRCPR
jgi:DNA transformation protein and related proteins